jgi:serine/threonine protein kinase
VTAESAPAALSHAAVARLREIVEVPGTDARYQILQRIGEGGMGAVYLAHDRELDREVALKVLRAPVPSDDERMRILREARILASLEHPGIVPVHDVGALADGRVFYVMKRVRGERLDDFARGERSRSELLRAFLQVCDAVAFAHAAGVIHRDLKPQNVMLGAFGEVLVLDWGVAKTRGDSLALRGENGSCDVQSAGSGTAVGTPGYMAPEQLRGAADARVDVFGLGGILFFLLTCVHPSPNVATAEQWPSLGEVPAPLRAISEQARALDPSSRYQSIGALAADVANYLDALPVTAHSEGIVERIRRLAIRHRTAILLVLAYLAMRVALLIFARR